MKLMRFVLTVTIILTSCSDDDHGTAAGVPPSGVSMTPEYSLSLTTYSDCSELQDSVYNDLTHRENLRRQYMEDQRNYWKESENGSYASTVYADSAAPAEASSEESFTNVQEKGIDEADFIKVGEDNIYVLRDQEIFVTKRDGFESLGSFTVNEHSREMYIYEDKIIVIGGEQWTHNSFVSIYRANMNDLPQLIKTFELNTRYLDSRLKNGKLVFIHNGSFPYADNYKKEFEAFGTTHFSYAREPAEVIEGKVANVPCENIVKKPINDNDFSMLIVTQIDLQTDDLIETSNSTLGGGDQIYMGPQNLYITKTGYSNSYWISIDEWEAYREKLYVTKVSLDNESNTPKFESRGIIEGYPKDQYSFKEYADEDVLAVVTTSFSSLVEDRYPFQKEFDQEKGRNHLWILEQNETQLEVQRVIANFGEPGEDVRSVRFTEDMAYVVTFKKTDPLYSFNLSDPKDAQLIGQLKIPGFSTYMHPLGENQLIGVGYDADEQGSFAYYQGIQVSLFDVTNPEKMARTDNIILGQRGSSSEATHNPHAFFMDSESKTFALPVTVRNGKESDTGWEYATELEFSGAIFYQVDGDSMQEARRVTHRELIPESCLAELGQSLWWQNNNISLDINRIFKVDDNIVLVSRFGITILDKNDLNQTKHLVKFSTDSFKCEAPMYWYN